MRTSNDAILLQRPILENDWGRHIMYRLPQSSETNVYEILRLFASWNDGMDEWHFDIAKNIEEKVSPQTSQTFWTTPKDLQEAIRVAFRTEYSIESAELTKIAILAVKQTERQQNMHRLSSFATTQQVRVTATSRFVGTSNPSSHFPPAVVPDVLRSKFRFAYRVRIENLSSHQHVQLLGRYWEIREDDDFPPIVVDAPETGAVGQLPVLRPNQVFEYTSGADLGNSIGGMQGHFYMAVVPEDAVCLNSGDDIDNIQESEKFEAVVAPFPLVAG